MNTSYIILYYSVCVCVCVCEYEKEGGGGREEGWREGKRGREGGRPRETEAGEFKVRDCCYVFQGGRYLWIFLLK